MPKISKAWMITGGIAIGIGILLLVGRGNGQLPAHTIADPTVLPGIVLGATPWPAELTHLRERLQDLHLSALSREGNELHIHQHLDVFVDGNAVSIPAGIGINEPAGFIAPIHVHDTTGVIHIESPVTQTFTLGQFFDIWGMRLTAECIGGYCADSTKNLKVYVNGVLYQGDPRQLGLEEHQEITVVYGTGQEASSTIPPLPATPSPLRVIEV